MWFGLNVAMLLVLVSCGGVGVGLVTNCGGVDG